LFGNPVLMQIEKMQYLIHLIAQSSTGTPLQLANRLEVSERMVYVYINILKRQCGAPVRFNKLRGHYEFEREGRLHWHWEKY
jgi:predicted DNA-binding transcriptional regulator YafY